MTGRPRRPPPDRPADGGSSGSRAEIRSAARRSGLAAERWSELCELGEPLKLRLGAGLPVTEDRVFFGGKTALHGQAPALLCSLEDLGFEDRSFDTAVVTLVLREVEKPERALDELARVLRPGGSLLFMELVRSEDPRLARWQDRLERPWVWLSCHPNRRTAELIRSSPFELERLESRETPKAPPIVRPLIVGEAKRPSDA